MARTLFSLLALLAALYVGMCAVLFFLQRSLIYFPQPRALPAEQFFLKLPTPETELAVSAYETNSEKAVIYFGGNAEDVSLSLPELRAAFPDSALYLLHYRGYGGSSGKPSEAALHRDAAFLYALTREKHAQVTVIGRSLGSGVAVRLAATHAVHRLILITPYYSLEELASRQFPYIPVRWIVQDKFESWRHAPRILAPTTFVVAERDSVVPEASSRALYSAFPRSVAEYILIKDADHNDISGSVEYVPALQGLHAGNPR
jgi:uncharacterized protein